MKKVKVLIIMGILASLTYGIFSVDASQNSKTVKKIGTDSKNEEIHVKLTEVKDFDDKKFQIFEDAEQNQYIYLNNDFVGFYREAPLSIDSKLKAAALLAVPNSKEKIMIDYKKTANDLVNKIVNKKKTDMSNYELTDTKFSDSYNEFSYTYTKNIDGYKTNDSITISLDTNGELSSLSAPRQGLFSDYDNVKIDKNDVNKFIEEEVKSLVDSNLSEDKYINYSINYEMINIVDNKLVLEIAIGLQFEEHRESAIIYYEI